jgi:hypothetical protein
VNIIRQIDKDYDDHNSENDDVKDSDDLAFYRRFRHDNNSSR